MSDLKNEVNDVGTKAKDTAQNVAADIGNALKNTAQDIEDKAKDFAADFKRKTGE